MSYLPTDSPGYETKGSYVPSKESEGNGDTSPTDNQLLPKEDDSVSIIEREKWSSKIKVCSFDMCWS